MTDKRELRIEDVPAWIEKLHAASKRAVIDGPEALAKGRRLATMIDETRLILAPIGAQLLEAELAIKDRMSVYEDKQKKRRG